MSVPSTTAALYDTSKSRIDDKTLTYSDWDDIAKKLREPENNKNADKSGDFAFIQKNTDVSDNGHWMLLVGFTLIALSLIGFIYLIVNASRRKRAAVANSYRAPGNPYAQTSGPRYRREEPQDYVDDFGAETAKKPKKSKKSKNSGRRYR